MSVDDDGTNCDKAEEVGAATQKRIDNTVFTDIKLSRKKTSKLWHSYRQGFAFQRKWFTCKIETCSTG